MSDDARSVAFNSAAPPDERFDAQAELQSTYKPLSSALLPDDSVREVIAHIVGQFEEAEFRKAKGSGQVIQFPGMENRPGAGEPGMRSVFLDEMQVFAQGAYYEKQSPIDFLGLRTMVDQTPILSAIKLTRIRQVSSFSQISEDGGPGFEIRHIDRKHKLQGSEAEQAALLAKFFANCGWEFNPRRRKNLRRDSFSQFMAKSVGDALSMDSCPIETEFKRDRSYGLDGFYAVDGATIRLCTEHGYQGDDEIFAVQVVQGRLTTTYDRDQLIYEVRNPRTDVTMAGYGLAEPELMIKVVTGFLNAMNMNISGFDQNAIPRGMLHLSGKYGTEELAAFRRYWNAMVKGANNAWSLPVMVSEDQESKASFEKFGVDFNEMMFSKFMTFLASIACAIYSIAPEEINFESFAASNSSSLSGSDTTQKLAASKDKGLKPLLSFYEAMLSDFIVGEFNPDWCFRWVGLEDVDDDAKAKEDLSVMTLNELRARRGDAPFPDPQLGDAPLNPSLIGPWLQMRQQAQQPAQDFGQADGADAGGGGGPGDPPMDGDADEASGGNTPPPDTAPEGAAAGPAPVAPGGPAAAAAAKPSFGGKASEGAFGGDGADGEYGKRDEDNELNKALASIYSIKG
jgi:hypothetical protein